MHVLAPGAVLGGCRIEEVVGRGGMGVVYRARQLELDRAVAVKVLAPYLIDDEASRGRFLSEARAAGAVEHPHVLPVHSAGVTDDGVAYLVLRYIAGKDLRDLVARDGPFTPARAVPITQQLGGALDAIHAAGYVHRDVKPRNVLVDAAGHAYLTDFGLAKEALASSGPTPSEQWVGTLDYVAPEQLRGERVDHRADVYAFGGVVFFMLTGRAPFEAHGGHAKLWAHLFEPAPSLSHARPDVPAALDAAVKRALAKEPERRQASAGELARAVAGEPAEEATATDSTRTAATLVARRGPQPRVRPRWTRGAALGLLGVVAAAAAVALTLGGPEDGATPTPTPTPTQTPAPSPTPGAERGKVIRHVGRRPHDVVVAAGNVFVLSYRRPGLDVFDEPTGKPSEHTPYVGYYTTGVTAYGSDVWFAVPHRNEVVRVDPRAVRVTDRVVLGELRPVEVALGRSGLWIACQESTGEASTLLRYDSSGANLLQRTEVPYRIRAMTEAGGDAWLAPEDEKRLLRLTTAGGLHRAGSLTEPAEALTQGGGRVWASTPAADAVVSANPRTGQVERTFDVRMRPAQLAVTRSKIFVAGHTSNVVAVLDADDGAWLGTVKVPPNPFAVAARGRHVWVAGERNTLTRLDLES